jgi:hypothetical protein
MIFSGFPGYPDQGAERNGRGAGRKAGAGTWLRVVNFWIVAAV